MQRHYYLLSYALILVMVISFILWFYTHFERVTETIEVGFHHQAYRNPVLAAEQLLQRMGVSVQTTTTLPQNLTAPHQETLVLAQAELPIQYLESIELLSWVAAGGHLIMVSDSLADSEPVDPLLDTLGIAQYERDTLSEVQSPTALYWAGDSLQVAFHPYYRLTASQPEPKIVIGDNDGAHLLHYVFKAGRITVLSDLWFIENDQIGAYDHAQFFWQLVTFKRHVTRVWLWYVPLHTDATPTLSLGSLLWQHASSVLISMSILILIGFWAASRRFGPVLPNPPRKRRRLLEHIEASGHFLWQHQQGLTLLEASRQAVLARLEARYPEWRHFSPAQRSQRLAQLAKLTPQTVEQALYTHKSHSAAEFTQIMHTLTQIKSAL